MFTQMITACISRRKIREGDSVSVYLPRDIFGTQRPTILTQHRGTQSSHSHDTQREVSSSDVPASQQCAQIPGGIAIRKKQKSILRILSATFLTATGILRSSQWNDGILPTPQRRRGSRETFHCFMLVARIAIPSP
jgi:hypothetical protein